MNNTVQVLFQKNDRKKLSSERFITLVFCVLAAVMTAWVPIVLLYEIPCLIGKHIAVDIPIVKSALRAEQVVIMRHRTHSYAVNKLLHELEEIKMFYALI